MRNRLFKNTAEAPQRLRISSAVTFAAGAVESKGGMYGAGLIEHVSLVTRGEALGHEMWLDSEFIGQVYAAGAAAENGLKARFAHPGLSSDGIGSTLGRWLNFQREGDQVFADLHLLEAAHDSPDGDLAAYVMKLAAEAPDLFGASIVFDPDYAAEIEFDAKNQDKQGRFISPDPENKANLMHARLRDLIGADIVDEPAANPDGLFSSERGNALPAEADALLDYALGLSVDKPELSVIGIDADRARSFIASWMDRRGLSINSKDFVERACKTATAKARLTASPNTNRGGTRK